MPHIIPIKELKDTSKISDLCHTSSEPIYITKNGYGDMVVMSIEVYESMAKRDQIYKALEISEKQVAEGKTRSAEDALSSLRMKYEVQNHNHFPRRAADRPLSAVCFSTSLYSKQGASAIIDDVESAFRTLRICAESFAYCEDPHLRSKGYRKLSLAQHDYILIYRVSLDVVYIMGFFHMRENYHIKL